jgi:hypothetical protein
MKPLRRINLAGYTGGALFRAAGTNGLPMPGEGP